MKIAAYLATLLVRLLGAYLIYSTLVAGVGLLVAKPIALAPNVLEQAHDSFLLIGGVNFSLGCVMVGGAGRIVRLFTADAPLGDE